MDDELIGRALIRAATAFTAVLLVGGAIVALTRGAEEVQSAEPTSSSPTATGTATADPAIREAWLAWVPGGLPEGFGSTLTTVPEVTLATTATAGTAWMTRSLDDAGAIVDDPPDPYLIPIDVTGVEPVFASFVPQPERRLVETLDPGEAILSESAANLRGVGEGAALQFQDGAEVSVIGTLPDPLTGGYELVVTRATAETLGVTVERYVLFNASAEADPQALAEVFLPLVPADAPFPMVQVRAPGQAKYLRANDGELPPALLKAKFGEFTAQPGAEGSMEIDPSWVQENILTATLPQLGTVTCHRKAVYLLKQAMKQVAAQEITDAVGAAGLCFDAVADPASPDGPLSSRAFGASIEIDPANNAPGDAPAQDLELVAIMERWGFGWAGQDAWPQGALFRYQSPPSLA